MNPVQPNVAPTATPIDLAMLTDGASLGLVFRFDAKADKFILTSIVTVTGK
jgi:hypothetical protein